MRLALVAVGRRMPVWVSAGVEWYARRLPARWRFVLREIGQGGAADAATRTAREGEALLDAARTVRGGSGAAPYIVALDERGPAHDTRAFSARLERWQTLGRDVVLLVGGPDGLHESVRSGADEIWSLSPLTFPHPLVRVIVVEQLYRAHSLLSGHPYHRD